MKEVFTERKKMLIGLKVILLRRNLQQLDLARLAKTTPARISRILRGHVQPQPRERVRIARVLRVASWRLFPNTGRGRLRAKRRKGSGKKIQRRAEQKP